MSIVCQYLWDYKEQMEDLESQDCVQRSNVI